MRAVEVGEEGLQESGALGQAALQGGPVALGPQQGHGVDLPRPALVPAVVVHDVARSLGAEEAVGQAAAIVELGGAQPVEDLDEPSPVLPGATLLVGQLVEADPVGPVGGQRGRRRPSASGARGSPGRAGSRSRRGGRARRRWPPAGRRPAGGGGRRRGCRRRPRPGAPCAAAQEGSTSSGRGSRDSPASTSPRLAVRARGKRSSNSRKRRAPGPETGSRMARWYICSADSERRTLIQRTSAKAPRSGASSTLPASTSSTRVAMSARSTCMPSRQKSHASSRRMVPVRMPTTRWLSPITRSRNRLRLRRATPSVWLLTMYRKRSLTAAQASRGSTSRVVRRFSRVCPIELSTLPGWSGSPIEVLQDRGLVGALGSARRSRTARRPWPAAAPT